jgi:transcriptional regulator with XRE-family HTH domain
MLPKYKDFSMARSLLGTRIRERRRAKNLSQTALAGKAGISTSYMNLIEHNHRGIAGRTLLAIADSLDIDPKELSEGADQALLTRLQEAASASGNKGAEIDRLEEYVGRFPGWSHLSAQLFEKMQDQEQRLLVLSDRLGKDPFFSEAMHLMLSNVTVLKSTSEILATTTDISTEQSRRFFSNMQTESGRLSETITKLLAYFDDTNSSETKSQTNVVQSKLEQYWESHDFHIPDLETPNSDTDLIKPILTTWQFKETGEEEQANKTLTRYRRIAELMPFDDFVQTALRTAFNPVDLARVFNTDIHDVFFRLAHLPQNYGPQNHTPEALPRFGLIECDGSGGVLFRKPLKTLSLPRKSSACPLWPLYRAISQPMQPIRSVIETPTGESFITHSFAQWSGGGDYGLPETVKSAMLFTADYQSFTPAQERRALPTLKVGLNCEVCPRSKCPSRRAESILDSR